MGPAPPDGGAAAPPSAFSRRVVGVPAAIQVWTIRADRHQAHGSGLLVGMTATRPLAAWVELLQSPASRRRDRRARKYVTLDEGAVRLSRGRSVLPPRPYDG